MAVAIRDGVPQSVFPVCFVLRKRRPKKQAKLYGHDSKTTVAYVAYKTCWYCSSISVLCVRRHFDALASILVDIELDTAIGLTITPSAQPSFNANIWLT